MRSLSHDVRLSAIAATVVQVMGSFGAVDNQPARRPLDAIAMALVLLGPSSARVA